MVGKGRCQHLRHPQSIASSEERECRPELGKSPAQLQMQVAYAPWILNVLQTRMEKYTCPPQRRFGQHAICGWDPKQQKMTIPLISKAAGRGRRASWHQRPPERSHSDHEGGHSSLSNEKAGLPIIMNPCTHCTDPNALLPSHFSKSLLCSFNSQEAHVQCRN